MKPTIIQTELLLYCYTLPKAARTEKKLLQTQKVAPNLPNTTGTCDSTYIQVIFIEHIEVENF